MSLDIDKAVGVGAFPEENGLAYFSEKNYSTSSSKESGPTPRSRRKYVIGFAATSAFACLFFKELRKLFEIRFLMTKAVDPKSKLYSFAKYIRDKKLDAAMVESQREVGDQTSNKIAEKLKNFKQDGPLPCYYPIKMKEIHESLFDDLDAMIVIAYGHKIPKRMLDKCVWINLHGSILPKFRGAAPINYSIIAGEESTGLSATIMVEAVDAGPVIETMSVPIQPEDNSADLALRMQVMGREWFAQTVFRYLEGELNATPQDASLATFAPSITAEDRKLDWSKSAFEIHNKIRALSPNMCCSLDLGAIKLKLVASKLMPEDWIPPEASDIGKLVAPKESGKLIVKCGKGFLRLTQVIPDSSKEMSDENFVRGYSKLL